MASHEKGSRDSHEPVARKIFYTPTPTCYKQKPAVYARQCTCPISKGSMKLFILSHIKYYVCRKIYVFVQSSGGTSFFWVGGEMKGPNYDEVRNTY